MGEKRDFSGSVVPCAPGTSMQERAVSFGPYRLDRNGLTGGAGPIRLTPKSLALLYFLAERAGQVVTKDELFAGGWPTSGAISGGRGPSPRSFTAPRSRTSPSSTRWFAPAADRAAIDWFARSISTRRHGWRRCPHSSRRAASASCGVAPPA